MDDIVPLCLKLRHTSTSPHFIQNLSIKKRQTFRNNVIADFSDQTCKQMVMILLYTWTPYKMAHCLQGACWQQGISTPYFMFLRHCRKLRPMFLTHWGQVTHICVSILAIIGWDNGLSPGRRQAIIWTNAGILLIRTLETNFSGILGEIHSFSFSKMHLKMSSAKWRLVGLGLNELTWWNLCTLLIDDRPSNWLSKHIVAI